MSAPITSFAATHKAISKLFDSWQQSNAVLFAENQPENPPKVGTWMRWSLRPADTFPVDCTGAFERTIGLIYVQMFTPETKGTRVAHDLADKLKAILNEKRVLNESGGTVVLGHVTIRYVATVEGVVQHNAIVPFSEDGPSVLAA